MMPGMFHGGMAAAVRREPVNVAVLIEGRGRPTDRVIIVGTDRRAMRSWGRAPQASRHGVGDSSVPKGWPLGRTANASRDGRTQMASFDESRTLR
jgi:hypothetical protein